MLSWDDLDADAGTIEVRRTLVYVNGQVWFKEPKSGNSRRLVELSADTIKLLRQHRSAQVEHRLALGPLWHENRLIFPSDIGTPWIPRAFYRGYRRVVNATSLAEPATIDFHCLRHTAASQWVRRGVDIFTVSRRLGHAKASLTMDVYSQLLKGQQRTAAEALDHLPAAEG